MIYTPFIQHVNGLTVDEDFVFFDAGGIAMDLNMYTENLKRRRTIEFRVDWLKALYTREGFYLWYNAKG